MNRRPGRRQVLGGIAAAAATVTVLSGEGRAFAQESPAPGGELTDRLRTLEGAYSARLGVFAKDIATGRTVAYRAHEPFPLCSTFKTIAVAAVLRDLDRDGTFLARRLHYTAKDVTDSGYAPITGLPANLEAGMTVEELCAAALQYSDNAAANLLLRELGGPESITRFCRSIGDRVTRLDRWEPALNSAEPGRLTDTTSPHALGLTYARLTLGPTLGARDRQRLTKWLLGNTTGANRLRAGLPSTWAVAEKTGTGNYGTTNDAGVTWPQSVGPIVLTVLSTKHAPDAPADEPLIAAAARLVATALA
ncbi:class A beta-lactamase [Kitasatospora purpeofusca]|uniref:class A beta-lactamase n=1 Tax=Kitasatospora purpeofusca TaxID=67352 RepID=UPI00224DC456|nr:class A beta-lactamase [Kitasatospora purpeofusca]MCX4756832.1 class A beta-lactamase [Kitasatospora purpeofusca]WSR35390.1 class A beta-lactamase [Kitasatospora purpeofusca]